MQKPLVVEVIVRPSPYSIRRPLSYQVADAFPLPQPSSLMGALVCCLAKIKFLSAKGVKDEYIRELVEQVLDKTITATIKPLSAITVNPVILTRLRVLEKKLDTVSESIERGRLVTDAMVREYAYGGFAVYFVFRDGGLVEPSLKALYLLERMGDTESLVSVESVNLCEVELIGDEGEVDTSTRADKVREVYGDFMAMRQCVEEFSLKIKRVGRVEFRGGARRYLEDLSKKYTRIIYLPLRAEVVDDKILYLPSRFKVKTMKGFKLVRVKGFTEACLVTGAAL